MKGSHLFYRASVLNKGICCPCDAKQVGILNPPSAALKSLSLCGCGNIGARSPLFCN